MTMVEAPRDQEIKQLFGTDGVRGQAGTGLITPEVFAGLGYALVGEIREQSQEEDICIAVGRDTRPSSPLLAQAAMYGILAAGGRVINAGVLPTPGVQRIARDVSGGVMVTASHNPQEDNGGKFFKKAMKPTEAEAWSMSSRYWQQQQGGLVIPTYLDWDRVETRTDAREAYISDIVSSIRETFKSETPLADTLFVVDCANGAAMDISPVVFEQLGAEVIKFGSDPSAGINDNCGSEHLKEGLKEFLAAHPEITGDPRFVGAVAHDGDADRGNGMGFFNGELLEVTGSHILEALAQYPEQPGVVGTVYINSAAKERIEALGIGFEYCPNGDTAVTQALLAKQTDGMAWTRGAEDTAHSMLTDWLTSGDGTYAMAWYAAWAVTVQKKTFGQIVSEMPMHPSKTVSIPTQGRRLPETIGSDPVMVAAGAQQLDKLSGGKGRVLLRPSGTQALVRAMIEVPGASEEAIIESATYLGNLAIQRARELEQA